MPDDGSKDLPPDSYEIERAMPDPCEDSAPPVLEHGFLIGGKHNGDRWVLSRRHPLISARKFLDEGAFKKAGCLTLRYWADLFVHWADGRYAFLEDDEVRARVYTFLEQCMEVRGKGKNASLERFSAGPRDVNAVVDALRSLVHLPGSTSSPSWLGDGKDLAGSSLIAFRDKLLDVETGEIISATPKYFTLSACPFNHVFDAPEPVKWLAFLGELWPGDPSSLRSLRQWMGYLLTCCTRQQKVLLLHGPRRAGKGTIGRIIRTLVGGVNVTCPMITQLAGNFGLEPLIGKSVAIVSDARFRGREMARVTEALLCISGEDAISIARKHRASLELRLTTRFVFLTNELPSFSDSSGALPGRFIVLNLTRSFYGKEDPNLTDALLEELPGIVAWAIEGLRDLRESGSFVQPESGGNLVEEMEELASPVGAFVAEACEVGPALLVERDALFWAWKTWCAKKGLEPGAEADFGKDLRSSVPTIGDRRPRRGDGTRPRCYTGIALGPGWSMDHTHLHAGERRVDANVGSTVARSMDQGGPRNSGQGGGKQWGASHG